MSVFTILQRNVKWRFHNSFTIIVTILQPILWLVLYSAVASQTMQGTGISNYTGFILPGLIVLVSFSACSSGGIMNYMMKADGSFYRILIAPVRRSSIVLGQLLEAVLCTFLEVSIMGARLAEENPNAGWVIMNGNRIQIKRKQFEKIIDTLDAI